MRGDLTEHNIARMVLLYRLPFIVYQVYMVWYGMVQKIESNKQTKETALLQVGVGKNIFCGTISHGFFGRGFFTHPSKHIWHMLAVACTYFIAYRSTRDFSVQHEIATKTTNGKASLEKRLEGQPFLYRDTIDIQGV